MRFLHKNWVQLHMICIDLKFDFQPKTKTNVAYHELAYHVKFVKVNSLFTQAKSLSNCGQRLRCSIDPRNIKVRVQICSIMNVEGNHYQRKLTLLMKMCQIHLHFIPKTFIFVDVKCMVGFQSQWPLMITADII